jgi:hypothetical protein
MASTRSTTSQRRAQRDALPDTPRAALTALALRGARIQIAVCAAATGTLAGWADSTDGFAQTVGDELLRRLDGGSDTPELVAHVTAAASSHLRDLTTLPRTAADHFDARLGRAPTNQRRTR